MSKFEDLPEGMKKNAMVAVGRLLFNINFRDADEVRRADCILRCCRVRGLPTLRKILEVRRLMREPSRAPSLAGIYNFADFFGLDLRKRIKALAGDFEVEIIRLQSERRFKTAKWNKALAWGYAVWYVLRGPFDWIVETFIKSKKGL